MLYAACFNNRHITANFFNWRESLELPRSISNEHVTVLVLIRPLHFADEGSATRVSVFHHCMNIESVQYYTINLFVFPSAPHPLSFLTHECDNHLLYSDGAFEYCFTKAGFYVTVFLSNENSMRFSPFSCFYFFFGSAYLLYIVHTQSHFHCNQ